MVSISISDFFQAMLRCSGRVANHKHFLPQIPHEILINYEGCYVISYHRVEVQVCAGSSVRPKRSILSVTRLPRGTH